MARIANFLIGLLLLPVCAALTMTVTATIRAAMPATLSSMSPALLGFSGGFVLWVLIFFTLPRPVRSYVFAHELTHAIWGMAMGARISRMKVAKEGGSVTLSKSNLFITLAPYFFPFYTVIAVAMFLGLSAFYNIESYYPWCLGVIGFTWGYHVTFTVTTLMQKQTDIQAYGYLLSYALIYLMNLAGICIWIIAATQATFVETGLVTMRHIAEVDISIWHFCRKACLLTVETVRQALQ